MKKDNDSKKNLLEVLRHSTSHVMADAVQTLFPGTRVTIGPSIEEGFYYDFDTKHTFTPEDLAKIEKKMGEIIRKDHPFIRKEMKKSEAIKFFKEKGEPYKVELLEEMPDSEKISVYEHGSWVDLCRGPHLKSTGEIKAFKLLSVAGAYWRGDSKRQMLQRIYGTAFFDQKSLDDYIERLKEVEARDHRRLGQSLDLFSTMEGDGAGLVLWHPRGALVRKAIEDFWREEHTKNGYEFVFTPHMAREHLWQTSGHLDFYKESMYSSMEIDDVAYRIKPMNCPFHIKIYQSRIRSYRELPLRWAELGTVYRYEKSGVLHGLMRVRGFTQDDAHLFCRADQLNDEIIRTLDFTLYMLGSFGFKDFDIFLSTRPTKFVGTVEEWDRATKALENALKVRNVNYEIDPGEGVFYGPKIDIKIKDMLGRSWQCSTIQVDFNLPERFNVEYVAMDGTRVRPIMIHRALLGSLERFFGVLIEHYAGAFPTWLAPVQATVINITDKQEAYTLEVVDILRKAGIRANSDIRNEKLGLKIREAEIQKIPYMLVIGKREAEENKVSARSKKKGDLGTMTADDFVKLVKKEVEDKK